AYECCVGLSLAGREEIELLHFRNLPCRRFQFSHPLVHHANPVEWILLDVSHLVVFVSAVPETVSRAEDCSRRYAVGRERESVVWLAVPVRGPVVLDHLSATDLYQ